MVGGVVYVDRPLHTLTRCQGHPRHGLPRLPQRCEGCQPTHLPGPGRRMPSLRPIPRYPKRDHYPTLVEARRTDGGAPHGQDGRVAGSGDCHERTPSNASRSRKSLGRTEPPPHYLRRRPGSRRQQQSPRARAAADEKLPPLQEGPCSAAAGSWIVLPSPSPACSVVAPQHC